MTATRRVDHAEGRRRARAGSPLAPATIRLRVLTALEQLGAATPAEVANAASLPVSGTREALLTLYRAGSVERLVLPDGVLYAPPEASP